MQGLAHTAVRNHLRDLVLRDAIQRSLPAETGLLDTAKRRGGVRDKTRVDADHADLEVLRHAVHALDVAREEVPRQPDVGRVGQPDDLLLGLEREQARDGAEGLLLGHGHVLGHAGDDGGLVKVGAEAVELVAADDDLAALLLGVADVRVDLVDGTVVDEGPVGDALLEAVADLEFLDLGGELLGELVVDAALDVDAVGADASLARGAELGGDGTSHSGVDVGVIEDDEGGVAAELEGQLLEGAGALLHEQLADVRRAGEGDLLNGGGGGEGLADLGGVVEGRDDVDDAFRDAGAVAELSEGEGGEGGLAGGFAYDRAARGEGRADLAGDHGGGEVPSVEVSAL